MKPILIIKIIMGTSPGGRMDCLHCILLPLPSLFPCRLPASHHTAETQIRWSLRHFSHCLEQRPGPWWCVLSCWAGSAAVTAGLLPDMRQQTQQILPKIMAVGKLSWEPSSLYSLCQISLFCWEGFGFFGSRHPQQHHHVVSYLGEPDLLQLQQCFSSLQICKE